MKLQPVAVVTGAASGMGRALALQLADEGCAVAISDVDEVGLAATADGVRERGAPVLVTRLDVRDRDAWAAHATEVVARFGRVNYLFNNAGVAAAGDVLEQSQEDLDFVLDVDLHGVLHGTRAFLPHLIASGDGHLVNTSSIFGVIAVPTQSAYNAAKFAVRGFTEALGMEMKLAGHPVTVHCVHPGGVRTAIADNARLTPNDRMPDGITDLFNTVARMAPEKAARIILRGVRRGKRRIHVGADAHLVHAIERTLGSRYVTLIEAVTRQIMKPGSGSAELHDVDELASRRVSS